MGLFKKKEPREPREDDSTFMKLWLNKRTHAMMVLGAYFVFFAILLIIINVASPKTTNVKTNKEHLTKLFNNINEKNYKYNHMISYNNKVYYFSGTYQNEIMVGKIIDDDRIIPVKIENASCAVGEYGEDGEFIPQTEECPSDINYSNFITSEIYKNIKDVNISPTSLKDHYYLKLNNDTNYDILFENDDIKAIVINDKVSTYQLRFNYDLNSNANETLENNTDTDI